MVAFAPAPLQAPALPALKARFATTPRFTLWNIAMVRYGPASLRNCISKWFQAVHGRLRQELLRRAVFKVTVMGAGGGRRRNNVGGFFWGAGGGGGATAIATYSQLTGGASYTCTLGSGGSGGGTSNGGSVGSGGSSSTITINSVSLTANGGGGGQGTGTSTFPSGGNGGVATNGTVNIPGQSGLGTYVGNGGGSSYGAGGNAPNGSSGGGPGNTGTGCGGGGSGAVRWVYWRRRPLDAFWWNGINNKDWHFPGTAVQCKTWRNQRLQPSAKFSTLFRF